MFTSPSTSANHGLGRFAAIEHTRTLVPPSSRKAEPLPSPAPASPLSTTRGRVAKRALDLGLGIPLAIIGVPLVLALVMLVKTTSRGPAFFTQERVGRDGRPLTVYKLRTMHRQAESHLHADDHLHHEYRTSDFKLHADPRVTRVGRHLRRTSLDEVPQIFQVVAGQMSLVGPRPVLTKELETLYGAEAPWYLLAKPGMTGAWQVGGRSNVRGRARVLLDVDYVRNWSFRKDLAILARTVPTVLSRKGAV